MADITKQTFICLDCETTGLDPKKDQIVEVAVVRFDFDQTYEEIDQLIDPGCLISPESMAIHHITEEMIKGKPKIHDVLPQILKLVGNHIIMGHGIGFDIDILATAAEKGSIPCNMRNNRTIDTLRLARLYGESPVNSLEQLRKHFNVPLEGAHRAMSDVIVNVAVFKHLVRKFKTVEQLFEALSRPIQLKTMPLGKHKGRAFKEVPIQYLQWAAHQEFDQDLLFSIRSEIKRRKKGDLFTQVGNPFSTL
jgi:DNA polymerase III subunit epsilon